MTRDGLYRLVFRHNGRDSLDMPLLLLSPKISARALLEDKRLAAAVLPEAFRQVSSFSSTRGVTKVRLSLSISPMVRFERGRGGRHVHGTHGAE